MANRPVTDLEKRKIKRLYKKGWNTLKIATEIDRNEGTVRKHIKEMGLIKDKKEVDLVGQKFGKLTVIELDPKQEGRRKWICKCECGNTTSVREYNLKSGNTKSCGCTKQKYLEHKKLNVKQVKTRNNQGGVYFLQAGEIILKGNYEGEKKCSKIKEYKMSSEELAAYLKELEHKEVKRRGR